NSLMPHSTANTDKKQLSFVYQPGIGLYDKKKIELDQDLRITSSTADVDERIQSLEISPTFSSDVDHRLSSSSSLESPSPNSKTNNLYKSYLRRQNEQDSLPIRQKLFASDDSSIDKNLKISDVNETTNQENNQKRKSDQNSISNKKLCQSPTLITKQQSQTEIVSKPTSCMLYIF
ncbi:unnamed protein product, partial [Adineta steineri]